MTKRALVTGATGQDAWYLMSRLRAHGIEVHAQSRADFDRRDYDDNIPWHFGDLTSGKFLETLIRDVAPDQIYNLAAVSRPAISWQMPTQTTELNALVPQRICEVLHKVLPATRLFQACTSDIFGDTVEAQNEDTPCVPRSPYGVAKLYAHRIIGAYRKEYGLFLVSGILFNHESPRRPVSFVSQKIAHAAAAISLGLTETAELNEHGSPIVQNRHVQLGDLSISRDFGFAGDYVEAMHLSLEYATADDYVIGSGETHSLAEFCESAFRCVGLDWKAHVLFDDRLVRKVDNHYTRADISRIRDRLGWNPKVRFNELVKMMVDARVQALQST